MTVGPSLSASLECSQLKSFVQFFFCKLLIWICATDSASLFLREASRSYSDYDFCITIPRCYKDIYVNSFFPVTAKCRNSLSKECFPLTYDLNGFNSRINRHLLTVGSFLWLFRLEQSESKLKRRCYMAKKRASF